MELAPPLLHSYLVEGVQVALTHPVHMNCGSLPVVCILLPFAGREAAGEGPL